MKKLLVLTLLYPIIFNGYSQNHKETISKEFSLPSKENGILILANINGSIDVEGYNGDKILFEIKKEISADDENELKRGIAEMGVDFETRGDTLFTHLKGPFKVKFQYGGWSYNGSWEDDREYEYNFDFKIKVPNKLNLRISTVNHGNIKVSNVDTKSIRTNNVNGAITLDKVSGTTRAHTVNGDVKVTYNKNPEGKSSFHTINGDIEVSCLKSLSSIIGFDSMNGEMYTDFNNITYLPAKAVKEEKKHGKKTTYKISYDESFKVGKGAHKMKFKTLNGDVYLKEI